MVVDLHINPLIRIDKVFALDLDDIIQGWQHELCSGSYRGFEVKWSGFLRPVNQDVYTGWWQATTGVDPVIVSPIMGPVQEVSGYDVIDTSPQSDQLNISRMLRVDMILAAQQQMTIALQKLMKHIDEILGE